MILRKYNKFLEELKITRELTTSQAFDEFIELIKECPDKIDSDGAFHLNYSYAAQERRNNFDPESDFNNINEYMSRNGYDLETINKLAEDYGRDSFNLRIEDLNPSRCAAIDYYLYKITNETFPLQGYRWDDMISDGGDMSGDPTINEFLIRFGYGWHNTKYGRLCIEQNMKLEDFLQKVKEQLPVYIFNELNRKKIINSYNINLNLFIDNFLNSDGTMYAHLDELYDICKQSKVEYEEFCQIILDILEEFKESVGRINITRLRDEIRISI